MWDLIFKPAIHMKCKPCCISLCLSVLHLYKCLSLEMSVVDHWTVHLTTVSLVNFSRGKIRYFYLDSKGWLYELGLTVSLDAVLFRSLYQCPLIMTTSGGSYCLQVNSLVCLSVFPLTVTVMEVESGGCLTTSNIGWGTGEKPSIMVQSIGNTKKEMSSLF